MTDEQLSTRAVIGANPKMRACANELADHFQRNWKRKGALLGATVPVLSHEVLAATLYGLLYSGRILCPEPEHRIGISLRDGRETVTEPPEMTGAEKRYHGIEA